MGKSWFLILKGFKANSGVSTSSNSTVISKRSRLEEMTEKEKQIQKEIRPESPVEIDGPVVKICLRLPCGNKETMTMSANQTIGVCCKIICVKAMPIFLMLSILLL